MTEPDGPKARGFVDQLRAAPAWIRVAVVAATVGFAGIVVAGAVGISNLDGPDLGTGTTVSRECLGHFEASSTAFAEAASTPTTEMFANMSDAFFDCDSLLDWNMAVSLYPGSLFGFKAEVFVRESCAGVPDIASSRTCRSLD